MSTNLYIPESIRAAVEAGHAILEVYRSDFKVDEKSDHSPITLADRRSHQIIVSRLSKFDIPILSEEGKDIPYPERKNWEMFWLVDPLDGTKEFIKRNGEFTVNIALISKHKPVAGVVFVPDKNLLYFASTDIGSYKAGSGQIIDMLNHKFRNHSRPENMSDSEIAETVSELISNSTNLPVNNSTNQPYTIVGSRSHSNPELEGFVEEKRREHGEVEFISAGSSLKFCLIAEGKADVYPRTGPTSEWDTAAGQAIVENAGGKVVHFNTDEQLVYNKESLLNPWFIAFR